MHILIIEDEEQLCRSMAEGLRISSLRPFSSLCPNLIENNAPLPIHRPRIIDVINVISVNDEPTAASAFSPRNCPTISVSAIL